MRTVPQALLFDLGGVVVDIDFDRAFRHWAPQAARDAQAVRQALPFDEPYQRHETGHLASQDYFRHLREHLALHCDDAALRAGWNAILVGGIAETLAMIDQLRGRIPCHAISNTNAVHLAHMRSAFPGLLQRFDRVFASHEIGHRKPHPEAFAYVLRAIGVDAPHALFFDDLPANVEAARACGLQAVLVRGPADVRAALGGHGLLP